MSAANILLRITAEDLTAAGMSGVGRGLQTLSYGFFNLNEQVGNTNYTFGQVYGAMAGASAAFLMFYGGIKSATTQSADLEFALAQMDIAISDSSQHAPALQKAVIDIGNASIFTHTQVAQVFQALGEMGYTSQQILDGVGQSAVNMSIAMGVDGVTGAHLLGQAMQTYNADAGQASSYSDMLTRSFYDSGVGADGLQQAISMAGGTAHNMGVTFQDFMTTTDLLSRSMGSGSKAGTSLRYMLSTLVKPTAAQADELNRLGIVTASTTNPAINSLTHSVLGVSAATAKANGQWDGTVTGLEKIYKAGQAADKIPLDVSFQDWAASSNALNDKLFDSTGHFLGLKNAIDQIQKGIKGMSPEQIQEVMSSLFNVRGGQGASQLAGLLGTFDTKYQQIYQDVTKAGTAQKDANALLNTAQGRWSQLTTTLNSFMSQVGKPINDVLKNIYGGLNNLVGALSNNDAAKTFMTSLLVVGTALGGIAVVAAIVVGIVATGLAPVFLAAAAVFGIIVGVAALVAGAFTLIHTHISQLSAAWHSLTTLFMSFLGPVIQYTRTQLGDLKTGLDSITNPGLADAGRAWTKLMNNLKPLLPVLQTVGKWLLYISLGIIAAIVVPAFIAITAVVSGVITGLMALVSGIINFFAGLLQAVSGYVNLVIDFWKGLWTLFQDVLSGNTVKLLADWNSWLNSLKRDGLDILQGLWHMVIGLFEGSFGFLGGLVYGFVQNIIGWFKMLYDKLVGHSIIPDMANAIVGVFLGLGGALAGVFGGIVHNALSWGLNLMGMLTGGIVNGAKNVLGAVWNVAKGVKSFLGFHSPPTDGPLSDANTYMPNMMDMFGQGISGNTNAVLGPLGNMTGDMGGMLGDMQNTGCGYFDGLSNCADSHTQQMSQKVVSNISAMKLRVTNHLADMTTVADTQSGALKQAYTDKMTAMSDELVGHSIIPDMATKVGSVLSGMASNASIWGGDLMSNLTGGIQNGIGNLTGTLGNVAGKIKSFLGFSKPDMGPLADADTYGGDFVDLLARGMHDRLPSLNAALRGVATAMSVGVTGPAASQAALAGASTGQGNTIVIPIQVGTKEVGRVVFDAVKHQLQMSGAARLGR